MAQVCQKTRTTGSSAAVTPQSPATRAHLPKQYKPHIAPHSRALSVTRARRRFENVLTRAFTFKG